MIVFIEGVSKAGKTTFINKFLLKHNGLRFKGAGQVNFGISKRWVDYNFFMHNIIERLDSLNQYKQIILWDRGLTEALGNDDLLRMIKSHKKCVVIYIDLDSAAEFNKRASTGGSNVSKIRRRYDKVLKCFKTLKISVTDVTHYNIIDEHIENAKRFIDENM